VNLPIDVAEAVLARFRRIAFFEAVDMLGHSAEPPILRFRAAATLGFPAHEIASVQWEAGLEEGRRLTLTVPFLGLYGPASPLASFYTERLVGSDQAGRNLQDFLDIFNHVAIGLLLRVRGRARALLQPGAAWLQGGRLLQPQLRGAGAATAQGRAARNLYRLGGLPALSEAAAAPQGPDAAKLLAMAGLLAFRRGTAGEMEAAISLYLGGVSTKVEQWQPRSVRLPDAQLSRLGRTATRLGSLVMGRGAIDPGGGIRLRLEGLDALQRAALLPGTHGHARLAALLRKLSPPALNVELVLQGPDPAPFRLGQLGARLGLTSRIGGVSQSGEVRCRAFAPS
jgi:type VI secretion system protein ImpH